MQNKPGEMSGLPSRYLCRARLGRDEERGLTGRDPRCRVEEGREHFEKTEQ